MYGVRMFFIRKENKNNKAELHENETSTARKNAYETLREGGELAVEGCTRRILFYFAA